MLLGTAQHSAWQDARFFSLPAGKCARMGMVALQLANLPPAELAKNNDPPQLDCTLELGLPSLELARVVHLWDECTAKMCDMRSADV